MIARLALLLTVVALVAPAAAVAQDNPFGPVPQAPPQQTQTVDPNADPTADDKQGLSRRQEILIGLAGFALLFGIGYAIVRDARSVAPADRHDPLETGERVKATRAPKQQRVARGRAQAKRARQSRKKNR